VVEGLNILKGLRKSNTIKYFLYTMYINPKEQ